MPDNSTPTPPSDEQLVARAQQGCAKSFEELVRRYQVPLVHFLRQCGPDDEAEDVAQEAFIRAYENLASYRPRWRFSTWLFTIARRLSVSRRRRARPMADAAALESLASAAPDPADAAAENESRRRLWDVAADVLGEEQVTALWLYYVEEMPVRQIARVLGRFTPAVKTMLHRARKKLLARLEGLGLHGPSGDDAGREPSRRCPATRELNHG
jgi:RNA polymerase sigma-70 factor, ECF subfamily